MMKRAKLFFPLAAVVLAASVPAAAPITVTQKGLQFSSTELSVSKGQMVVFMNDDRTAHNITVKGDGMNLNGGLQQPGAEFRVPFAKPGVYEVSCGIHPKMKLEVTVK
jgi:cytochrome c peroxidase